MMVVVLGDSALLVCRSKIGEPLEMLSPLDKRFASKRTATRIFVLTAIYWKRFIANHDKSKYIDEFETLFAQLERMGPDTKIPQAQKAPFQLARMRNLSPLESTVASQRTRDMKQLS